MHSSLRHVLRHAQQVPLGALVYLFSQNLMVSNGIIARRSGEETFIYQSEFPHTGIRKYKVEEDRSITLTK